MEIVKVVKPKNNRKRKPKRKVVKEEVVVQQLPKAVKRRARRKPIRAQSVQAFAEYGSSAMKLFQEFQFNPYLSMLIQPKVLQLRLPDKFSHPTALYTSYQYFDVVGNNAVGTLATDLGKFSFLIQPIIGNPYAQSLANGIEFDTVTQYNPGVTWGAFDTRLSYEEFLDPNYTTMIGTFTGPVFTTPGLVEQYRPLAMSAWFQCTASSLQNGGEVSALLTDGASIDEYYGALTNETYLQEYKNLAAQQKAYTGKLRDGSYTFWKPFNDDDYLMRQPYTGVVNSGATTTEAHDFPSIIISGISQTPGTTVGRIEVITVYEYTSNSRVVAVEDSPVAPGLIVHAMEMITHKATSMANAEHQTFIQQLLGILGSATKGAIKEAGPQLLEALLTML
jgi:hypothetical protein